MALKNFCFNASRIDIGFLNRGVGKVSTVLKARGQMLMGAYADNIGCAATAKALAAHQTAKIDSLVKNEPPSSEEVRVWQARLDGVVMRAKHREQIFTEFPALIDVYKDPLWLALDPAIPKKTFDRLAYRIRIDGQPLSHAWDFPGAAALPGIPHWSRLGYMLTLMRAGAYRGFWQCLCTCCFSGYLLTCCLDYPCHLAASNLFESVDTLVKEKLIRLAYWPRDAADFMAEIKSRQRLGEAMIDRKWIPPRDEDPDRYLMSQFHLTHHHNRYLAVRLDVASSDRAWMRKPARLGRDVQRALAAQASHTFGLS